MATSKSSTPNVARYMGKNPEIATAVRWGSLIFASGQAGKDPVTGKAVSGDIKNQTRQAIENVRGVLEQAGSSLDHVIRALCIITSAEDRAGFGEVFREYFAKNSPARTTIVAGIPSPEFRVEIEVIAGVPDDART